jgi:hypothetical protein
MMRNRWRWWILVCFQLLTEICTPLKFPSVFFIRKCDDDRESSVGIERMWEWSNRGRARDLDFNKEKGELIEDGVNRGEKLKNICRELIVRLQKNQWGSRLYAFTTRNPLQKVDFFVKNSLQSLCMYMYKYIRAMIVFFSYGNGRCCRSCIVYIVPVTCVWCLQLWCCVCFTVGPALCFYVHAINAFICAWDDDDDEQTDTKYNNSYNSPRFCFAIMTIICVVDFNIMKYLLHLWLRKMSRRIWRDKWWCCTIERTCSRKAWFLWVDRFDNPILLQSSPEGKQSVFRLSRLGSRLQKKKDSWDVIISHDSKIFVHVWIVKKNCTLMMTRRRHHAHSSQFCIA